ncbi:unnamed protein product [Linum tenue]|uniref:Uncharacterized protein n=1 Tax=Linum tenue TaxID=586396 RepID=A0AAV0P7M7_9ROSI|nr:unnamed protein product [Linum tenue]
MKNNPLNHSPSSALQSSTTKNTLLESLFSIPINRPLFPRQSSPKSSPLQRPQGILPATDRVRKPHRGSSSGTRDVRELSLAVDFRLPMPGGENGGLDCEEKQGKQLSQRETRGRRVLFFLHRTRRLAGKDMK